MKTLFLLVIIITATASCGCSQTNREKNQVKKNNSNYVGGPCEGCEAIYETPVPFEKLKAADTLPDFNEPGPKLEISGIVYQADGKTPAGNVVIYVYHTDQAGRYTPGPGAVGWEKRNGRIRGWVKTDKNGSYQFHTLKPASYPNSNIPAHIHIVVKEPDRNEYYIDEYLFEGDRFLTPSERKRQERRGGNGIILLKEREGMLYGTRDIILGQNIPGYRN